MSEIYKFFNGTATDIREYQAADFADYFGSVLSTGLLHTDEIPGMAVRVVPGTLQTVVSPGKAIMRGHLYENTTDLTLTHSLPESTLDRIDRVVLRLDLRNAEQSIKLRVKEGVASASPVAPALQRDNFIYELSLARVLVRKNTVQLLAGDLVDERLNEAVGGLVHSLISIPTEQFQRQWDEFMASVQDEGFATVASVQAVDTKVTTHLADDVRHIKSAERTDWNSKLQGAKAFNGNLNTLKETGFYYGYQFTNGAAPNISVIEVQRYSVDWVVQKQIIIGESHNEYIRHFYGGTTWSPWINPFQSVVDGKNSIKSAVLAKGGTVSDVNNPPTYADLVAGVNSLNAFVPGSSVFASSLAEVSHSSESWKTAKKMTFNKAMKVRISFAVRSYNAYYRGWGQIFINGVAVGTRRTGTTEYYVTYSEDFDIKAGDVVELRIYANFSGYAVYVNDFTAGIDTGVVVNL